MEGSQLLCYQTTNYYLIITGNVYNVGTVGLGNIYQVLANYPGDCLFGSVYFCPPCFPQFDNPMNYLLPTISDDLRCSLRNSIKRRSQMPAYLERYHGGIDHPYVLRAVDLQRWIYNSSQLSGHH